MRRDIFVIKKIAYKTYLWTEKLTNVYSQYFSIHQYVTYLKAEGGIANFFRSANR
jgi:hypothetical protein